MKNEKITTLKIITKSLRCNWWLCQCCDTLPLCCFSGFLRSDILIGVTTVKLQPLETVCEIHDSFDVSNKFSLKRKYCNK